MARANLARQKDSMLNRMLVTLTVTAENHACDCEHVFCDNRADSEEPSVDNGNLLNDIITISELCKH